MPWLDRRLKARVRGLRAGAEEPLPLGARPSHAPRGARRSAGCSRGGAGRAASTRTATRCAPCADWRSVRPTTRRRTAICARRLAAPACRDACSRPREAIALWAPRYGGDALSVRSKTRRSRRSASPLARPAPARRRAAATARRLRDARAARRSPWASTSRPRCSPRGRSVTLPRRRGRARAARSRAARSTSCGAGSCSATSPHLGAAYAELARVCAPGGARRRHRLPPGRGRQPGTGGRSATQAATCTSSSTTCTRRTRIARRRRAAGLTLRRALRPRRRRHGARRSTSGPAGWTRTSEQRGLPLVLALAFARA